MIPIPDFLQKYVPDAEELIAKGCVQDIQFSGATYQVKVGCAESQDCWSFVQLDNQGILQDAFCSCREEDQSEGCVHIVAALLKIYQDPLLPLHERYEDSLWNALCHLFFRHFGNMPKGKNEENALIFGQSLKFLFKTEDAKKKFNELMERRTSETEETSLKFSNLPEAELSAWRKGHPSEQLQYELSVWSDMARILLFEQDNKAMQEIKFEYNSKEYPSEIRVEFEDFNLAYKFKGEEFLTLINSLATVDSPLKVFNKLQDFVSSVSYDEKNEAMLLEIKPLLKDPSGRINFAHWYYLPKIGFYPKETHPLLQSSLLIGNEIADALDRYASEIAPLIKGTALHLQPVKANYDLHFDANFNLHIATYVLEKNDLLQPYSRLFGDWVYVEKEGFFWIYDLEFPRVSTVIQEQDISDFIRKKIAWLNLQEGFKIHLQSLEAQISYKVDGIGRLSFEKRLSFENQKKRTKDFGLWVYVEDEGFYSKSHISLNLPLQPGVAISPDQIPNFIHHNRSDLDLIQNFFCPVNPFIEVGLNIALTPLSTIEIVPFFQIKSEFLGKRLRFYDDIVYIENVGFYELPKEMRLPENYTEKQTLKGSQIRDFIHEELNRIREFISHLDPKLQTPAYIKLAAKIVKNEFDDYVLKIQYATDRGEIPFTSIYQSYRQKQPFYFSPFGLIDLADSRFDWFRSIKDNKVDLKENEIHLTPVELIRLNALEEISCDEASEKILNELIDAKNVPALNLAGLKSILRPYQEKGVHWLYSLYEYGLSGLLCDDMGLGKTHQAMGLFTAIQNKSAGGNKPVFLVVCPTSVLYHWQEKLQEFLPSFKILIFHGTKRKELLGQEYDILLTSYGILRNEVKFFQQCTFTVAIYDEIQVAKNYQSRLYNSLLNVQASMYLGLTGTPIENRLRELKALFDIVLPTYMPTDAEFSRLYIKPIERDNNMQQKQKLTRLIKPFILRRKKEDVLLDLPDKTEEMAHCDLHPDQAKLYREVLMQGRERLIPDLADSSKTIPYIHIFALLSHLKQIVDHPALFLKKTADYKKYHSGKWDLFVELLQEARESEQKVVIFSQYLGMLDIIENYLKDHGIGYAGIRGVTKDRSEQIKIFHNDPKCEVFVASLKAAGLGIDLTAGSVVIHYDRWWNKAREDQATDRVHRIGQHRNVQVFKLITKKTFEERIHELIRRKGQLMEEVIGVDDHEVLKRFSRDELMQLLQDVPW